MKLKLKIKSMKDIEDFVYVFYSKIPLLPKSVASKLTNTMPLLTTAIATYLLTIAILPFFFTTYPLDPLQSTDLYTFNIYIMRVTFVVIAGVLFTSFKPLTQHSKTGWHNLFVTSLFFFFYVLMLFQPVAIVLLFITWYILFSIRPLYKHE